MRTRTPIEEAFRRAVGGRNAVTVTWILAGACFVALVSGLIVKEAGAGCPGAPRAEADLFTRTLFTEGRAAAATLLAGSAQSLIPGLPDVKPARPSELARIIASGEPDGPDCDIFAAAQPLSRKDPAPCFGYDLPQRLSYVVNGSSPQTGILFTVDCESGRWRVTGFL